MTGRVDVKVIFRGQGIWADCGRSHARHHNLQVGLVTHAKDREAPLQHSSEKRVTPVTGGGLAYLMETPQAYRRRMRVRGLLRGNWSGPRISQTLDGCRDHDAVAEEKPG